jgi:hypothetical protein
MYDENRMSADESAANTAAEAAAFAEESAQPVDDDLEPAHKPATVAAEPTPSPAPTLQAPTASQTPAQAPNEAIDPYADLPPAVRDVLAELPTLRHEAESNRGRVAALNRTLEETRTELARVKAAPTPPPEPPKRDENLAKALDELPGAAQAVEDYITAALKTVQPKPDASPPPTQSPAPAPATDPEMALLDKEYPGWGDKIGSTDFKLWLGRQTPEYQTEVMRTNRSGVLITAMNKFDRFKQEAQPVQASTVVQKRTGRIAAAVTPQGAARPSASRASVPQTEEEGFEAELRKPTR